MEPKTRVMRDPPAKIPDAEVAQIARNLALSPAERLDQLVRAVAFVRAGRAALERQRE